MRWPGLPARSCAKHAPAVNERSGTQIVAIEVQKVERVEQQPALAARHCGPQLKEIRNAVQARHHDLAVENGACRLQLGGRGDDGRALRGQVVAVAGKYLGGVIAQMQLTAPTIQLDLVSPLRTDRQLGVLRGVHRLDEAGKWRLRAPGSVRSTSLRKA